METESEPDLGRHSSYMQQFIRPLLFANDIDSENQLYPFSSGGTCFLLSVCGRPYIVTAAHCFYNNLGDLFRDRLFVFEDMFADHFVPIPYCNAITVDVFGTDYDKIAFFPVDTLQYRNEAIFLPYLSPNIQDFDINLNCIFVAGFRQDKQDIDYEEQFWDTEMDVLTIRSLRQDTETNGSMWKMNVEFNEDNSDPSNSNRFDGLSGSPVIAYNHATQTYKILGVVTEGHHSPRLLYFVSFLSPRLEIVLNAIPHRG